MAEPCEVLDDAACVDVRGVGKVEDAHVLILAT
jgi:hypothetical protein